MKLWLNVREGAEYVGGYRDTVCAACERREMRRARQYSGPRHDRSHVLEQSLQPEATS